MFGRDRAIDLHAMQADDLIPDNRLLPDETDLLEHESITKAVAEIAAGPNDLQFTSRDREPAVDADGLAVNVTRRIGGQPHQRRRDLPGVTEAIDDSARCERVEA